MGGDGWNKDLAVCRRNVSANNEKESQYRFHNAIFEVCLSTSMSLTLILRHAMCADTLTI